MALYGGCDDAWITTIKEPTMNKRILTVFLGAAAVAAVLTVAGVAGASSSTKPVKLNVVPIVMADPGCHWFRVSGKNLHKLTVVGATGFRNLDEAALVFKGKNFVKRLPVGKTLAISKAGVYHITMVGQHPDDNNLTLVVK
jgi:hypothetical protein